MDATATKSVRINRLLPYWAVLQADVQQTLRSWIYRFWVFVSVVAAGGYLLYRVGLYREAGIVQAGSTYISDLLRWTLFGSVTFIVVLTAGSICAERGTMADSVLSRGISRYQYFLGKWHSRLFTLVSTYLVLAGLVLVCSCFMLHEDLDLTGCVVALVTVAALLVVVITLGVTISAMANNTLLAIAVLWVVLYGTGFVLWLLPAHMPSPDRALGKLPNILRGLFDVQMVTHLIVGSVVVSSLSALVGLVHFARRDV